MSGSGEDDTPEYDGPHDIEDWEEEPLSEDSKYMTRLGLCQDAPPEEADIPLYMTTRAACSMYWLSPSDPYFARNCSELDPFAHKLLILQWRIEHFDNDIADSMLATRKSERRLAESAFSASNSISKADTPSFLHGLLQTAVYDRMAFTLLDDPLSHSFDPPLLPTSRPDGLKGGIRTLLDLSDNWKSTLKAFSDSFITANATSTSSNEATVVLFRGSDEDKLQKIITSLALGADHSTKHALYASVRHNFCMASLGLLALCLKPKVDRKTGKHRPIVENLLETVKGDEATTALLKNLKDYDLLRAIYFVAVFSPFSILSERRLSMDNAKKRVPLYEAADALRYPPPNYNRDRISVEHDLLLVIKKMAMDGCQVFDSCMKDNICKWDSLLNGNSNALQPQQQLVHPAQDSTKNGLLLRKVLEHTIEIAHKPELHVAHLQNCDLKTYIKFFVLKLKGERGSASTNAHSQDDREQDSAPPDSIHIPQPANEDEDEQNINEDEQAADEDISEQPLGSDEWPPTPGRGTPATQRTSARKRKEREATDTEEYEDVEPVRRRVESDVYKLDVLDEVSRMPRSTTVLPRFLQFLDNGREEGSTLPALVCEDRYLHYKLPRWNATAGVMGKLMTILENQLPLKDYNKVHVVAGTDWEQMPTDQRRRLFEERSILVVRVGRAENRRRSPLNINLWKSHEIQLLIDTAEQRRVEDFSLDVDSPRKRMRRAPVSTIIEGIINKKQARALHCAYLPVASEAVSIPIHDFDDASFALMGNSPEYIWRTELQPSLSLGSKWVHVSTRSTMFDLRIETSGLATYISPMLGEKLICIPEKSRVPIADEGLSVSERKNRWHILYVENGCDLYIRPNTPYFEVNLGNCMTLGGHFYCNLNFSETMIAILIQHYFGHVASHPIRATAPLVFFKVLDRLVQTLKKRAEKEAEINRVIDLPPQFPSWYEFACLLILVNHIDQLTPMVLPDDDTTMIWQKTAEFKADHAHAKELVRSCMDLDDMRKPGVVEAIEKASEFFMSYVRGFAEHRPDRPDLCVTFVDWSSRDSFST